MKTYRFIALAAVCFLSAPVFFSCAKEDVPSTEEEKPGISVLFAEIDQQTKVYLGEKEEGLGYPLNWNVNDMITVWNKEAGARGHYVLIKGDSTTCAQFTLWYNQYSPGIQPGSVYAFYPYENTNASGSTIDFSIVREQNYRENSFGYAKYATINQGVMPMAASSDDTTRMRFHPLMSALKIQLKDNSGTPVSVSSIVVRNRNTDNQKNNMSASTKSVRVNLTDCFGEAPVFDWTVGKECSDYVTLKCDPAVQLGSDSTTFYIVVPAGSDISRFTVLVHTTDGKFMKKSMETKFRRNYVKAMPTLQFQEFDYNSIHYIERNPADPTDMCDYGPGVMVGGVYWAPVNCGTGYNENEYPHGLVYQWGRLYGQDPNPAVSWSVDDMTFDEGQSLGKAQYHAKEHQVGTNNVYTWYSGTTSLDDFKDDLWNQNIQFPLKAPLKTTYDPCPEGWRVPTNEEAESLKSVSWTGIEGNNGISYTNAGVTLRFEPYNYHNHAGENVSDGNVYLWTSGLNGKEYSNILINKTNQSKVQIGSTYFTNAYAVRCVYDGLY